MKKLTLLLMVFSCTVTFAQDSISYSKLNQFFDILEQNHKFMGAVAAYHGDELLYARYVGYADLENKILVDSNTKFRIGSISKMFTSVLVFREIDKGNLSLETKLSQYFPQIKNADKISIGQLLSHRSGIHNFTDDLDYQGYMKMDKTRDDLVEIIQSKGVDFEPGSKMKYSNSNFVLLTFILEDITHKSYHQLVNNLCAELGLKDTQVGEKITPAKDEALSYYPADGWKLAPETSMTIPLGAGSIISTTRDLNFFIQKLFDGEVISDGSLSKMTALTGGVGYGIFGFLFYNQTRLGHNGGIDGFRSNLSINDNVSLAVLGNAYDFDLNTILIACLSSLYNRDFELPDFSVKEVELDSVVLKSLEGTFVSSQLPLKISIVYNGIQLTAQASGQSAFPLRAYENGIFKFDPAGIQIVFTIEEGQIKSGEFQLKQNGMTYSYKKE
nr:serine hydrolase domain-containing protein [uncultured Carboxylicivirga sp.]